MCVQYVVLSAEAPGTDPLSLSLSGLANLISLYILFLRFYYEATKDSKLQYPVNVPGRIAGSPLFAC